MPWIIVWFATPSIGPLDAFIASFKSTPEVQAAIATSAPLLLIGGGVYLIFLFFHWLFIEPKSYGLPGEQTVARYGAWFFAVVSVILTWLVWRALQINSLMAFSAVLGSTAFFITHGFKQYAEQQEKRLQGNHFSDISKILYLEAIDATFSIDSVLGAFAFTLSVPLILLGNGLGALIVRHLTIKGVHHFERYVYLKNGAMYSILFLGIIMIVDGFGHHVPAWISPIITFGVVGFFFIKSRNKIS